jgi:hypothetical protein
LGERTKERGQRKKVKGERRKVKGERRKDKGVPIAIGRRNKTYEVLKTSQVLPEVLKGTYH